MTRRDPTPRPKELLDYLRAHPDGARRADICRDLNMSTTTFWRSLHRAQVTLGKENAGFTVIAVPLPGRNGLCVYMISEVWNADAQAFHDKEVKYLVTRAQKLHAVLNVYVHVTDGRTQSGKIVRILHRHLGRALEDLAEV